MEEEEEGWADDDDASISINEMGQNYHEKLASLKSIKLPSRLVRPRRLPRGDRYDR